MDDPYSFGNPNQNPFNYQNIENQNYQNMQNQNQNQNYQNQTQNYQNLNQNQNMQNQNQNQNYQNMQNQNQNQNQPQTPTQNVKISPSELEKERNKTDNILKICIENRKKAIENFKSLKIVESIELLEKERNMLLRIKDYIEKKAVYLSDYLQYIIKTTTENNKILNKFEELKYLKIAEMFTFKPKDKNTSTIQYINKYILETPFITFNDIYDPIDPNNDDNNNNLKKYLSYIYLKSTVSKNKTLLLYGPKGCGKSISAMAIANHIQAKFIQIDNLNFFNVEKFSLHLASLCIQRQPIIVYLKNIDAMLPVLNLILYFIGRIIEDKKDNKILIIASSTCKPKQLPKELYQSFILSHYIGPFILKYKKEYIKFICMKLNITLNVNKDEFEKLCSETFKNYSNEDIKKVLCVARELNENNTNLDNGNVLNYGDLVHGSSLVPSSITPEVIKQYNL